MARRRWIDPSFWDDLGISRLTPIERLFFIGCFSNADDEGRLIGNPAYLRAAIFKYDDITLEEMREIRDNVASLNGNLILYEDGGEEYLAFRHWADYQKPNYPKESKLPAPAVPTSERSRDDVEETEERENADSMGRVKVGLGRVGQDRCADGADHSALWQEIRSQMLRLHDPTAVKEWTARGEVGEVTATRVVVRLHPSHAEFVAARCARIVADAIALAAPELAEREVVIEPMEVPK